MIASPIAPTYGGAVPAHPPEGYVISLRDVTHRKQMEAELAFRAFHDPLTGLPNRLLFHDRTERALARSSRNGTAAGLVFIDLDDFKDVNDGFGHACGDQLLTMVAERLSTCLRETDTAARLGGDEFALIIEPLSSSDEALQIVGRVIEALRRTFRLDDRDLSVSASVGIAISSGQESTPDALLHQADVAMYAAKAAGKNRCELYSSAMEAASRRSFALSPAVRA